MVLQFGSLPASGSNHNRSTFIDNNLYGALESPNTPSQITVTTSPGQTTTMVLPLFNIDQFQFFAAARHGDIGDGAK